MRSSVKRLIAVCVVLFLIISLSACSLFEKNLTIDAILALKTKQDVIDLLGEPKPYDNPDADPFTAFYDFVFMDNNISSLVAYEGEAIDAFL